MELQNLQNLIRSKSPDQETTFKLLNISRIPNQDILMEDLISYICELSDLNSEEIQELQTKIVDLEETVEELEEIKKKYENLKETFSETLNKIKTSCKETLNQLDNS
jgi:predicted  nucleic acid-binding Zn-ribbon protein